MVRSVKREDDERSTIGNNELVSGSDNADANPPALALRVLLACLLRLCLRPEGLRKRCELPSDIFEEEPLLSDFGHENL